MIRQAYVCGSYSAPSESITLAHVRAALGHAHTLASVGWSPIVPHVMGSHRATWDEAMVRCRDLIRGLDPACDVLVTLPGWECSRGAQEDVELAREIGIRVVTMREALR